MMKIGFFTDTYNPQVNGVVSSIQLLKDELEAMGHQILVFSPSDPAATREVGVVRLASLPFPNYPDRRIVYQGLLTCMQEASRHQLDLVHTHTEFSLGLIGLMVARYNRIPHIHTYHTMYENYTHLIMGGKLIKPKHVRRFSKLYCQSAEAIIAPSKLTSDTLASYGISRPMEVIPTGVRIPDYLPDQAQELRRRLGYQAEDIVILSLSRLSKEKQVDKIIKSFSKVVQAVPRAKLLVVGDGPARSALEEMAGDLLNHQVQFIGQVNSHDVWRYYQMSQVYVNASQSESQGLTYLEALVNRLPVIATYNDYLSEIIQTAEMGRLYQSNEDLASVIIEYIQQVQPTDQAQLNTSLLENISVEHFANRVLALYERVVSDYRYKKKGTKERLDKILGIMDRWR